MPAHNRNRVTFAWGYPTYLRNQHLVAGGHAHGHALAISVKGAGADGQDLGLVELLDARLGQEDAAGRLGLGLDALHEHAVKERDERLDGAERGGLPEAELVLLPEWIKTAPGQGNGSG